MSYSTLVVCVAIGIVLGQLAAHNHVETEYDPKNPLSLQCRPKNSFLMSAGVPLDRRKPSISTDKQTSRQRNDSGPTIVTVIPSGKPNVSESASVENNENRASGLRPADAKGPCRLDGVKEMYNFAAFTAGAQVLASSAAMKGAERTLNADSDKYMSTPCSVQSKWFVIQLSEDVEVSAISVTNLEHYSSGVEYFQLLGSDKHPTPEWILMGYFRAENSMNEQIFCLDKKIPVRYLKFRLLSHYGNEQYCTLNSVKVYGSRLLEALGRALDETLEESRKTLNEIQRAGADLRDTTAGFLPNVPKSGNEAKRTGSAQAKSESDSSDSSDQATQRTDEMQLKDDNKGSPEKAASPNVATTSSSGPQNIITKLTNRIKDLEINQTLAIHAVERLSLSLTTTVAKLESAILSMDAVLVARDKSVQSLLASAVETTNASTITILLLRRQLASLNSAYENAESTLRMLRFALAIALITICAGIVAALFKTSSGPIYQQVASFQSPVISSTPATQRRRRRIRSGRLSKVRSMDLSEVPPAYMKNGDGIGFRPMPAAADDSAISYCATPRVFRQNSQPFISRNKFDALIDENEFANDSD